MMADTRKRKELSSRDCRSESGRKRSKGGTGNKWQTPHHLAKNAQNKNARAKIEPRDVGIWATCAKGREGKAANELKDLFFQYAREMYGVGNDGTKREVEAEDEAEDDVEASIEKELVEMRSQQTGRDGKTPLFMSVHLDIPCVVFIKARAPVEPVAFVQRICEDAMANPRRWRTRYTSRLTPMTGMGKATERGLEEVGKEVLGKHFCLEGGQGLLDETQEGLRSYAIRPTIRNHSSLKRDVIIKAVAALVDSRHKVNLTKPDKVIIVEFYTTVCGISVVDGNEWEKLKRFNLAEIYHPTLKTGVSKETPTAAVNEKTGAETGALSDVANADKDRDAKT